VVGTDGFGLAAEWPAQKLPEVELTGVAGLGVVEGRVGADDRIGDSVLVAVQELGRVHAAHSSAVTGRTPALIDQREDAASQVEHDD
jgi:hypothetical protein